MKTRIGMWIWVYAHGIALWIGSKTLCKWGWHKPELVSVGPRAACELDQDMQHPIYDCKACGEDMRDVA